VGPGSTTVKARSLQDGEWSALVEAEFSSLEMPLRISEIMFHPADGVTVEGFEVDDYEYIELVNISDTGTVDLEGFALTQGVEFVFPAMRLGPGERVLVVRNTAAFQQRYGTGLRIAGQYGGTAEDYKLSNSGELLRLEDEQGSVIQQFQYADDWYREADGRGRSLEILNERGMDPSVWGEKTAWRASIVAGGTPGRARSDVVLQAGDLNLDGSVGELDLDALVLALHDAVAYEAAHGVPPSLGGDADGDGDLDYDDLDELAALLTRVK
jgi:hypothetical protein